MIKIGIGTSLGIGSSGGIWSPLRIVSKLLYWGVISEITSGKMYNKVTGRTAEYLTIGGSAGTYTFQATGADYIAADTDYIWFKTDTTQRTTTEAELVGYDLPRTPVKYDSTTPYLLREIIILKAGEVLSTSEENAMRDYMNLSIWWSNVLSSYGNLKGNRGSQQSFWFSSAEYRAVNSVFITKPSVADATIQNTLMEAIVAAGVWSKAKVVDMFAVHSEDCSLINWKSPGTFNPTLISTPVWTQYKGYKGASGKALNSNFWLSTDGAGMLDNICGMYGDQNTNDAGGMGFGCVKIGANDSFGLSGFYAANYTSMSCNETTGAFQVSVDGKGHWAISRGASDHYHYYKNAGTGQINITSTLLPPSPVYICGFGHSLNLIDPSTRSASYFMLFEYLSPIEIAAVFAALETYLDNYGFGLV